MSIGTFTAVDPGIWSKVSCSTCYPLTPIGVGTGLQESLPSYIDRLATKHEVSVRPFLRVFGHAKKRDDWWLFEFSRNIRDLQTGSRNAVAVTEHLSRLTGQNLSALPMCLVTRGTTSETLLKQHLAWCPDCLAEWRQTGVVYRPYLWSLKAVACCPVHRMKLAEVCPCCDEQFPHLGPRPWTGFCPKCYQDLASFDPGVVAEDSFEWEIARTVVDFLSWAAKQPTWKNHFATNIQEALACIGDGHLRKHLALGGATGAWAKGRPPRFNSLLQLSYVTQIPMYAWLAERLEASRFDQTWGLKRLLPQHTKWLRKVPCGLGTRPKTSMLGKREVRKKIQHYLDTAESPSLKRASVALEISKSTIHRWFPDLAKELARRRTERRSLLKREHEEQRLRKVREKIQFLRDKGVSVSPWRVVEELKADGVTCLRICREVAERELG